MPPASSPVDTSSPAIPSTGESVPFGRTTVALAFTALGLLTQLYGVIPLLGHIGTTLSVSPSSAASVQSVFGFAYSVGFILWGVVVDRLGARRVMLSGLALLIPVTFAAGLAPTLTWVLVARAAQGLLSAAFAPAAFSYLGSRVEPGRRGLAMTVLTSSFLAAAVIGQVFAQAVGVWQGWRWFFFTSAGFLAAAVIATALVLRRDPPVAPAPGNPFAPLGRLVTRRRLLAFLLATPAVLGPFVGLYTGIQLSGLIPQDALLALRASALPALIAAPFANRFLSRVPPARRLLAAFTVAAVAGAALAVLPGSVWTVGVCMFAVALTVSVAAPAMIEVVMPLALPHRGAGTALYTFTLFAGASVAPQLVGSLELGLSRTALVSAAVFAAAGAIVAVVSRTRPPAARRRVRPPAGGAVSR
ncbi:putative MFS family arabinose efflux permease [Streptosporangium becharense]|uniref:Putative MFS family arabinose efflux permease n=1 Tax=Streptosporangium becharense TaxID=1816182 RepID=A0A7W9ILZ9_9ACTN|nr:MFS transporter [Streptosporangium becharense]MBB2915142.1 putative MFS family arabinose efflux permease [Streptosporangium becharense]MBB5822786.1 putative MFS family arabinose efflux permease [Streptosporangium becharense]